MMMLKPKTLLEVGWANRSHLSYRHCIEIGVLSALYLPKNANIESQNGEQSST